MCRTCSTVTVAAAALKHDLMAVYRRYLPIAGVSCAAKQIQGAACTRDIVCTAIANLHWFPSTTRRACRSVSTGAAQRACALGSLAPSMRPPSASLLEPSPASPSRSSRSLPRASYAASFAGAAIGVRRTPQRPSWDPKRRRPRRRASPRRQRKLLRRALGWCPCDDYWLIEILK